MNRITGANLVPSLTPVLAPVLLLILALSLGITAAADSRSNVDLPRFPSLSPDGSMVVFSWRGDLWKVSAEGGDAVRLTSHPADESRSAWSPDGAQIAFASSRDGATGLYVMNADGSDVRPVSDTDRSLSLDSYASGPDGDYLTFSARMEGDVYRSSRPYRISLDGGDMIRIHDAFGDHAVPGPDGLVAFSRGGGSWLRRNYRGPDARDVWLFDSSDGGFRPMTTWAGNDGQARWAGGDLLFLSDREMDRVNVYRMNTAEGDGSARRLTSFQDRDVAHLDVSADGSRAVLAAWDTLYSLDLGKKGGKARPLAIFANEDEADRSRLRSIHRDVSEATLSPDGKVMAFIAYGEVYVRNLDDKSPTRRVTRTHAREKDIAWSPDGLKLYYTSDEDGTESIFSAVVTLTRTEVKDEFRDAVHPPEEPEEAEEEEEGEEDADADEDAEGEDEDAEGEDADEEGEDDEEEELAPEFDPTRWHDAVRFALEPLVQEATNDRGPLPSPDGKSLAFARGRGDLMILDLESGKTRRLAEGWDTGIHGVWSPDSKHFAYAQNDMNFNSDIWIVAADGSTPAVNVTRHPDDEFLPRFSADGRILAFLSERVDEDYDVWMVYLDAELEGYTPQELEKYYEDAADKAKKREPLEVEKPESDDEGDEDDEDDKDDKGKKGKKGDKAGKDKKKAKAKEEEPAFDMALDDAYLRLRRVTSLSGTEWDLRITPAGDRYIFTATIGEPGLFSLKWNGKDREKLHEKVDVQGVSLTGDKVVFISKGRAGTVNPSGGKVEWVEIADRIRIDLEEQSSQKFLEAARVLGERFYHPEMKGLDWEKLTRRYHALARSARTASEFNEVANRFVGELNASHLGIFARGPVSPNAESQGRLGIDHRRTDGGFEVLAVLPDSPAARGAMSLQAGDVITAVEAEPFGPTDTLDSRLLGRVAEEVLLTLSRRLDSGEERELNALITPTSYNAETQLRYRNWRRENARKVDEWSGARIGYIHIQSMNQSSLDVFERDLYAAADGKDGLLIDVRNNGGGWTTDRLLASIMTREHAYTIPRGAPQRTGHYPQDRLFIQRYTLPINMLCNEKSFSNAEIISHAFKTLGRGTLVGEETYGAVISTGGTRLIDGTFVRLPFRGWYLTDGNDMENHGAVPDLRVPQTPEAESRGEDEQLEAAVRDLQERI